METMVRFFVGQFVQEKIELHRQGIDPRAVGGVQTMGGEKGETGHEEGGLSGSRAACVR